MHISKASLVNYRNFSNTSFFFNKGVNTVIGENASGKTNLFRAIRLLLDDSMPRSVIKLDEKDFFRGLGDWRGHWIIISLEFDEISQDESIQALFLHGLGNIEGETVSRATYNLIFRPNASVRSELSQLTLGDTVGLGLILGRLSLDDYEAVVTGKSSADFNDSSVYKRLVGDFVGVQFPAQLDPPEIGSRMPPILSMSKEVSFTFIQALRDVVSDFHNNRRNPLLTLLKRKSGEVDPAEFGPIANQVDVLNSSIEALSDVIEIRGDIHTTINNTVGDAYSPVSLSIKSDLSDEAEQLFQSLKLFIAESDDGHEGAIHEMSLGGANLIYLTLKLLEFKYQKANQSIANFLIVEEPEAHIHTHIQKSLFDKINYTNAQVIYSTHSSHISEVSNVKSVNVIGKVDGKCEAFQPAAGLLPNQIGSVQRYLDAIRSNLLFARSVVLVEGDAEEILIPILIKKVMGVSLDELGISLVNIRSTGFENVALLFHDDRIRKKCSIITDLDETFFDTTEIVGDTNAVKSAKKRALGSRASGIARKAALDAFCNGNTWVRPFYAPHTFEVDFIAVGNSKSLVSILPDVYVDTTTIATSEAELESGDIAIFGKRALTMANHSGKGWFAILLGKAVDYNTIIPEYIVNAIFFAHAHISNDVIFKILNHRLFLFAKELDANRAMVDAARGQTEQWYSSWETYISTNRAAVLVLYPKLKGFRDGVLNFNQIRSDMLTHLPNDKINPILARL
ncbi:AAA family ATPase [Mariprofundus sp. NF]|uniref:ATP-dependent nuclease n=1 Tax=Mariprofundus sp. NF TaxID=2608716 RepID=UPI00159FD054|nr:AAA family ATPase [Mariprofundus sp. NF]NWF39822.1 AAA family ATPase [Mariprofundus sp. NF]